MPQRPNTTLGMPAITSMNRPAALEIASGEFFDHGQRRPNGHGHGEDQSDGRAVQGAGDERERAVADADRVEHAAGFDRVGVGAAGAPVGAGQGSRTRCT